MTNTAGEVAVRVQALSKRYCRSMSRAMVYALHDIGLELVGGHRRSERLRREEFWALDGVELEARFGECLALLGPNGAGKSTLLRLLAGIVPPDRGRIELAGRAASLLELGAGFHPLLTGRENVYLLGAILGVGRRDITRVFDEIVEFSELAHVIDTPVKLYSSGMGMRLGFSAVAHLAPRILLVDEALAVGDVAFQRRCLRKMREYVREGGCVVLVTHDVLSAYAACSAAVVLREGRVAYSGAVEQAAAVYHEASVASAAHASSRASDAYAGGRAEMRYGSGEAELLELEIAAPADALPQDPACARLAARRPAGISLTLRAKADIDDAQVGVSVWDAAGEALLMLNSQGAGVRVPPLRAGQRLRVRFDFDCPLPAGRYRVGAGITSTDAGGFLDRRLNWRALDVVSAHQARSLMDIPYRVDLQSLDDEADA